MAPRGRQWLKVLGVAGVLGVAASGALITRDERRRRSYDADEIRERLHARYARTRSGRDGPAGGAAT